MSGTTKRRWYQFSLGTLMVAVTIASAVLARIAYIQSRAADHDQSAAEISKIIQAQWHLSQDEVDFLVSQSPPRGAKRFHLVTRLPNDEIDAEGGDGYLTLLVHHLTVAQKYRDSVYRPWTVVDESSPVVLDPPIQK